MKSLWKVYSIINCFTPDTLELTIADISIICGIPKPTAHRIVADLVKGGFLEKNVNTGKYRVGVTLYAQGSLYLASTDILKVAEPVMKTINELTGEAINLGILDRSNVVFIMKEETRGAFRFFRHIGSVVPAYSASMGMALLSELTDSEINNLFPDEKLQQLTKKTISTKTELKKELAEVREKGYAVSVEGNTEGAMGIAAAIRDASGKSIAALSIVLPLLKLEQYDLDDLSILTKMASNLISYRMGYYQDGPTVRDAKGIIAWWNDRK